MAWANRLASKICMTAGRLLRALALRQRQAKVSPLITLCIVGKNDMTDVASRSFWYDKYKTITSNHSSLTHHFNLHFLLTNKQYWHERCLGNVKNTAVLSELLGWRSKMALWTQIIPHDTNNFASGAYTPTPSV